jgi:hypothetical protein
MSMGNSLTVRILRTGNGKTIANPSLAVLRRSDTLVMKNWTECPAEVSFAEAPITPKTAPISPGGSETFTVDANAPVGYYEYDITLLCTYGDRRVRQYVEGGSRPGVIIDG